MVFGGVWEVGVRKRAAARSPFLRLYPRPVLLSFPCPFVFQVVWSVLLLVEMVLSYLNLAANFPVLTVDVVQRVVDLFRVGWCHFQLAIFSR